MAARDRTGSSGSRSGSVGRGARARARAPPHPRGRRARRRARGGADFIDLKSPYMAGHSRRCARPGRRRREAARARPTPRSPRSRRAALRARVRHDRRSRTRSWTSRVRSPAPSSTASSCHPMLTEQMLRRSPALDGAEPDRARRTTRRPTGPATTRASAWTPPIARRECSAPRMSTWDSRRERADRPALLGRARGRRAAPPRRPKGCSSATATDAVLAAAGHAETGASARALHPGGLTGREARGPAARGEGAHDANDRRARCSSRRRRRTITSSTSTRRSGSRPGPPPPSGRSRTTSSAETSAAGADAARPPDVRCRCPR